MLLLFFISHLLVLIKANPYHKYPYVFLLDVGNEEIEKREIEQIRLTIPGISMAVKYPAVGDGNLITHIRITAIDFGIDLKANIAEGGPGYKYVVIVFSGNPGKSYDAVVSIETTPVDVVEDVNRDDGDNYNPQLNEVDDETDDHNNKENIQDNTDSGSISVSSSQSEVLQSSSNDYKYSVSDVGDSGLQESSDNNFHEYDGEVQKEETDVNSDNYSQDKSDSESGSSVDLGSKISDKYISFKPHIYGGIRFYPQAAVYTQGAYEHSEDDTDTSLVDDGKHGDGGEATSVDY